MPDKPPLPPPFPAWEGFDDPNFTPVPDSFFDVLLPVLSDAEVRVLLYILRRTYGFKKATDRISLAQLTGGIVRHDGTRLDGGAGLGKTAAIAAVARLVARGIIVAERQSSAAHGHEPTLYRVRKAGQPLVHQPDKGTPPLVHETDKPLSVPSPSLVHETNTQDTVVQETVNKNGLAPPLTGWLYMIATDHARELGLPGDVPGRVARLWAAGGLDEPAMAARLYAAKAAAQKARGDKGAAYWAAVERGA